MAETINKKVIKNDGVADRDREKRFSWLKDVQTITSQKRQRKKKILPVSSVCPLCDSNVTRVSYKDVYLLKRFMSIRGKIVGRNKSGMCSKHQRSLSRAIKRARQMSLVSFVNQD